MSKSKGNTVDPQALIDQYGADTVRLFSMFAAPPEQSLEWADEGVEGASRYLNRVWNQVHGFIEKAGVEPMATPPNLNKEQKALRLKTHQTIEKVTLDVGDRQTFNTAIAAMMELTNALQKHNDDSAESLAVLQEGWLSLVMMLSPFAPHITQTLWQTMGQSGLLCDATWPQVDKAALVQDEVNMAVQVNGKLRATISVATDMSKEDIEAIALADEKVQKFMEGKTPKKVIVVPKKIVNVVI